MNLFLSLEKLLEETSLKKKLEDFKILYEKFQNNQVSYDDNAEIKVFTTPSFYKLCKIVPSSKVPKRTNLQTKEGMANLLHAIAHIEFSAIDLALDACYRFRDMPKEFYKDWMEVADDEVRHFLMIEELMEQYEIGYGDLPVHQGLFDASMKSLELIPRMALIPRYMEANGLDANDMLIKKLSFIPGTKKVIELLEVILNEEIDHVKKGDYWYKYACNQKEDFSCDYFKIVTSIYPNSFTNNKNVNTEARKKAGFSDIEIEKIVKYGE